MRYRPRRRRWTPGHGTLQPSTRETLSLAQAQVSVIERSSKAGAPKPDSSPHVHRSTSHSRASGAAQCSVCYTHTLKCMRQAPCSSANRPPPSDGRPEIWKATAIQPALERAPQNKWLRRLLILFKPCHSVNLNEPRRSNFFITPCLTLNGARTLGACFGLDPGTPVPPAYLAGRSTLWASGCLHSSRLSQNSCRWRQVGVTGAREGVAALVGAPTGGSGQPQRGRARGQAPI